ncbi:MAG: NAD(P)H-binding protein, partial [Betaproteobacteria bacterium]|nr:NAD(P)H-binding protein [Betaproteobacteria bacterium]
VTNRTGSYNRSTEAHDWKRRGERLLRASGLPYTVVRPSWFDYNDANQHRLVLLQGDTRRAGNPSDGVVARAQIAQVLVRSLTSVSATRKTFELVAERGPATVDFDGLFASLDADTPGELDAVRDAPNMPLPQEPERVREDLRRLDAREPHEV